MRKRGFTLVELLGVIILLGVIALITVPSIKKIIDESKQKGYERQIDFIVSSAKNWGLTNSNLLPDSGSILVKIDTLKNEGFLENKRINNPINNREITGCVSINYNSDYNQYEYKYNEACEFSETIIGRAIYFNPVKNAVCDDYVESNSAMGFKDGCMRWYAYKTDGESVGLILDHNTTVSVAWYKDNDDSSDNETNVQGPLTLMAQLDEDTTNWKVEADIIDASDVKKLIPYFQKSGDINSFNTFENYVSEFISIFNGLSGKDMILNPGVSLDSISSVDEYAEICFDTYEYYYPDFALPRFFYKDLFIYYMNNRREIGYWTKTPVSQEPSPTGVLPMADATFEDNIFALAITTEGELQPSLIMNDYVIGLRPVITLPKSTIIY